MNLFILIFILLIINILLFLILYSISLNKYRKHIFNSENKEHFSNGDSDKIILTLNKQDIDDLKLLIKKTKLIDNLNDDDINDDDNIKDYFDVHMQNTSEITHLFSKIELKDKSKKQNKIFHGYDNFDYERIQNTIQDNYIAFLFNLGIKNNKKNIEKFNFLDLNLIKKYIKKYNDIYVFITGKETSKKSYLKYLHLDKPIFIVVYKNRSDVDFEYEVIPIDLDKYYKFQESFLNYYIEYINNNKDGNENLSNKEYINCIYKFNESYKTELNNFFTDDLYVLPVSNHKINLFRIYNDNLDILVSVHKISNGEKTFVGKAFSKLKEEKVCNFRPFGETIFNCKQECYKECKEYKCNTLCNNCKSFECKWNLVDLKKKQLYLPIPVKVRGFAGDGQIKLSWIQPKSKSDILSYYILSENKSLETNNKFNLYIYKSTDELLEFVVNNLENNIYYRFFIFTRNKYGISDVSNPVTLQPNKNKLLDLENIKKDSYSDSIQNYYENQIQVDYIESIDKFKKLSDIEELKDVLINKMIGSSQQNYNIDIY